MRPHGTQEQLEKRRRQAITLLQKGCACREVAKKLKASLSSVVRWSQAHRKNGPKGLRGQGKWGRPCRLSEQEKDDLQRRLLKGAPTAGHTTDLWTLKRIGRLISTHYDVHYTDVGVWKILRNNLGWSCQKPERRALERDEKAIDQWKKRAWPHIKKRKTTWRPSGVSR